MKRDPDKALVRLVAMHGITEAARLLGWSPQTVKNNLSAIYRAWGVRSLAHAALVLGDGA